MLGALSTYNIISQMRESQDVDRRHIEPLRRFPERLTALYQAWGKLEKAEHWQKESTRFAEEWLQRAEDTIVM